MIAICVSVEYHDLLEKTLPWNAAHFETVLVVTSPEDKKTAKVARKVKNARLCRTHAFFRNGAEFNKGAAVEEAFDEIGREGWFCHLAADVLLPRGADLGRTNGHQIAPGTLYCAQRRLCLNPKGWQGEDESEWDRWGVSGECLYESGHLQVFHARDPTLAHRPWYPTEWRHAGESETRFSNKWPPDRRRYYPWQVLHLGPPKENWFGRVTPFLDGSVPDWWHARRERMARLDPDRQRCGYAKEKVR